MMLIYLSGVERIPLLEVKALVDAYNDKIMGTRGRIVLVERGEFVPRLAFSKMAGEVICKTTRELDLPDYFKVDHTGFAVETWGVKGKESLKMKIRFADKIKGKPNLSNPKEVFDLVIDGDKVWISRRVWENDPKEFMKRDPKARPVFNPTSLKPKLARLLVNLSGIKPGERLLDPFCGVGGILIEASLMGIDATGIEIDKRWADGARKNLDYYRLKANVINADFLEWEDGRFDAIVTDLPYGRSSKLKGDMETFYKNAFKKMEKLSKKLVVMGPMDLSSLLDGWELDEVVKMRVHKSLDRWIHVCSR